MADHEVRTEVRQDENRPTTLEERRWLVSAALDQAGARVLDAVGEAHLPGSLWRLG